MHYVSVIHVLGLLLMCIGATIVLPIPVSLYDGDDTYLALLYSSAITMAAGFLAYKLTSFRSDLRAKEGFAIVTFGWITVSLFSCFPFIFSGAIPSLTDAFFETMSGFTTTGATILTDIEALPRSMLLWRSLSHWMGGMGIILLSLAILPFLGVGGMQLYKAEVPGPVADKLTPRIAQTAKLLWGVYLLFTVAELLLLKVGGMSWFDALNHALATLSTGGYSTRNASVGSFTSPFIHYVITIFMLLAGVNFALHYRFLTGDFGAYLRDKELKVFVGIFLMASLFIVIDVYSITGNLSRSVQDTLFQVAALSTSTGFGTADFEQWSLSSQLLLLAIMVIGGCAGSTAGGMKVARAYLLFKFMLSEINRLIHPNAIIPVRMGEKTVPRDVVTNVLGFFVLYIMLHGVGVLLLSMMGLDMATSISAPIAMLSNIGPGLGLIGPTDNYGHLPIMAKWLLSLLMLLGRLEIFTVIILFSPSYWRK